MSRDPTRVPVIRGGEKSYRLKFTWAYGNDIYSKTFTLSPSGKITGYSHPNEATWGINEDGNLVVFNAAKKVQWIFKEKEKRGGKYYFETTDGRYLKQQSIVAKEVDFHPRSATSPTRSSRPPALGS